MEILYKNNKIEKLCNDEKIAIKKFGKIVAEKLMATMQGLESAQTLNDIYVQPQYHLHKLLGDRNGQYSIYLGKNTGYRLIIMPLGSDNRVIKEYKKELFFMKIKIEIEEVSKHYE